MISKSVIGLIKILIVYCSEFKFFIFIVNDCCIHIKYPKWLIIVKVREITEKTNPARLNYYYA